VPSVTSLAGHTFTPARRLCRLRRQTARDHQAADARGNAGHSETCEHRARGGTMMGCLSSKAGNNPGASPKPQSLRVSGKTGLGSSRMRVMPYNTVPTVSGQGWAAVAAVGDYNSAVSLGRGDLGTAIECASDSERSVQAGAREQWFASQSRLST